MYKAPDTKAEEKRTSSKPPRKKKYLKQDIYEKFCQETLSMFLKGDFEGAIKFVNANCSDHACRVLYNCLTATMTRHKHSMTLKIGNYLYRHYKRYVTAIKLYLIYLIESKNKEHAQLALNIADDLAESQPDNSTVYKLLKCNAFAGLKRYSEAEGLFDSLIISVKTAQVHHNYAIYFERRNRFDKAIEQFEIIYESYPEYWKGLIDYAVCLQKSYEEYDTSIEVLENALTAMKSQQGSNKPNRRDYAKCYHSLAIAYKDINRKKAISFCTMANKHDPSYAAPYSTLQHLGAPMAKFKFVKNTGHVKKRRTPYSKKGNFTPQKALVSKFEIARKKDPARAERNHPLPGQYPSKVGLVCQKASTSLIDKPTMPLIISNAGRKCSDGGLRRRNPTKQTPFDVESRQLLFTITEPSPKDMSQLVTSGQDSTRNFPMIHLKSNIKRPKKEKPPSKKVQLRYIKRAITKGLDGIKIDNKSELIHGLSRLLTDISNNKLKAKQTQNQITNAVANSIRRTSSLCEMYLFCKRPRYQVDLAELENLLINEYRLAARPRPGL